MLNHDLWDRCLARLEADLPDKDINTWIRPLRVVLAEDQITLLAPNRIVMDRVRSDYLGRIQRAVSGLAGYDLMVNLAVGGVAADSPRNGDSATGAMHEDPMPYGRGKLDPRYTLESFIEGKSNSQARAAGLHVASSPGAVYNPLLIYGESGLGKTHLMHGVGNAILSNKANARIIYVGAEQWFNQMVSAIRFGRQVEFKNFYRSVDALLIDDIHFLAGKEHSQEEFFHTFNALIDGRKQIVLTCDRYPRELDALDDRLKSRFTWGLSVPIEPPEFETRMAILLSKADALGVRLPEDVAVLVAQRIRSNVRELEGALHRLSASARLTGAPITVDFARVCLKDMLASYDRAVTLENIKRTVATYYNIRLADLTSARRTRTLARPRQIAMSLAKELTRHSYPEIGDAFGKDHTTVLHAYRKIAELRLEDDRLKEDYENLMRQLTN
ncbi:MAG: chromosomal replication initiator protein DnaA [Nevskia sp.]|jgi:chromosomal replication initiator protein|nr:chromosomal replication initiator protein DnaA [Nevskia sp.]MCK9384308.1 chromosomal replication initiator protein DnaA [Nevskia sp.]